MIWIDITNAPHVLFFRPIIKKLRERGHKITVTSRAHPQTLGMLEVFDIEHKVVGKFAGGSKIKKALFFLSRTFRLAWKMRKEKPDMVISHQSPYAMLAGWLLRTKKRVYIFDNETAKLQNMLAIPFSTKVLCPEAIPEEKIYGKKLVKYPGLKESVYLSNFRPNPKVLNELKIKKKLVVLRTEPGTAAYYKEGKNVLVPIIKNLMKRKDLQTILICRSQTERASYRKRFPKLEIPEKEIDAPSLLYYADLVVGAGGTMCREAAVLGTPVISVYQGKLLAVDGWLIKKGLMKHKKTVLASDVPKLKKRKGKIHGGAKIVDMICQE